MGEDGHTLSLFPSHAALQSEALVAAVHNSPKPPPGRISLTLKALAGADNCLIMVSGVDKAKILARALKGDKKLPIVQAVAAIEAAGGQVTWLVDKAAASLAKL
jgi:6-phosphogluconolactonase